MKKFILHSLLYVSIPFLTCIINTFFLQFNQGDLVRLGKLYYDDLPREKLEEERIRKYKTLNELNLTEENVFDVLTIGDSFSKFDNGYQNNLIDRGYKVVNYEHIPTSNPIQELIRLMNSDLFDKVQIDVVVLESIERHFNDRCSELDFNKSINIDSLYNTSWTERKTEKFSASYEFFSSATLTAPLVNLAYLFVNKPLMFSDTYKLGLRDFSLFSSETNELLIYKDDIDKMKSKNNQAGTISSVKSLNIIAEILAKKGIKLMVIIPPDKYELYYHEIEREDQIIEPKFYSYYNGLSKNYIDIPVYSEFVLALNQGVKNIYFYDDTHWSPVGQEIVAGMVATRLN
jgi:hypothetical protein